jgi:hypothetical protein
MEDDGGDKPANPLAECQEVVEHLKEENAQLRESAQTFGDLAERLNTWRRRKSEERADPATGENRSGSSSTFEISKPSRPY